MAGGLIEVLAADIGRDDFLIAVLLLNLAKHFLKAKTQVGAFGKPDGKTLAHTLAEHEQLHLLAYLAVVALLGFLEHDEILVEHLLLGIGDAVEALHLVLRSVAAPEGSGYAHQLDGLDDACADDVRTFTEVGEVALGIGRDAAVLEVLLDVLALVGLACSLKLSQAVGLAYFLAYNGLVLVGQLEHLVLNLLEVAFAYLLSVGKQHVVEEAVLDGGTEAELDAGIKLLQRLGEEVGAGVPEGVLALFVLELIELDACIGVDGTVEFRCLTIDTAGHNVLCQSG